MIELRVIGTPITQGSKTAIMPRGASRPVVVEAGGEHRKAHAAWRKDIAAEGRRWAEDNGLPRLLDEPLVVACHFALPRPVSAKGRWPIGARSGDADKLARSALDAVTGVLIRDDCLIVRLTVTKDYGDPPGVRILIWTQAEYAARLSHRSRSVG